MRKKATGPQKAIQRKYFTAEPGTIYQRPLAEVLQPPQTLASAERQSSALASDSALDMLPTLPTNLLGYCDSVYLPATSRSFIGYPMCAELSQCGLMRAGVETLADEMVRKWPVYMGATTADSDDAKLLNEEMQRLDIKTVFRTMAEYCGYFGGGLLYIDTGENSSEELAKPIKISKYYIGPGTVKRLIPVEPICLGPLSYNSLDPLRPDYFLPDMWYVTGRGPIHASRFIRFVKNEPPIILRPAYNFFGIPDVQIALDYMLHFTETRESAARLLKKFSLSILKTDANAILTMGDASEAQRRIAHMAQTRDNDGVYVIDFDSEDFVQVNTPLSGVTDIVRQALELLACIWRMPVVKYLEVSPSGMNATGESDIRSWYDHVGSQVEKIFGSPMESVTRLMHLNVFGEVKSNISWSWPTLWEMTEREQAEVDKIQADTDAVLLDRGIVDQEEVRATLASQPEGRYSGIDPQDVPPMPETPDMGAELVDTDLAGKVW